MKSCENKLSCMLNEDIGKLILRVSIAGLMLFHGFFKLFNGISCPHKKVAILYIRRVYTC